MKFTISTDTKTIEIHGSFKYEDFKKLISDLPKEWQEYEISLKAPILIEKEYVPYYPVVPCPSPLIGQPMYPLQPYSTGDTFRVTCQSIDYGNSKIQ